jgi:hypothetical protein
MRILLVVALALLSFVRAVFAQELDPDPNRIFVTPLKWKSAADESPDKSANGTLAILYSEGVYAEVTAAFVKKVGSQQIDLNLNDGSVVRLGTWNRIEDSDLIRVESRELSRSPEGETKLGGPLTARTCRLERPSSTHIADTIVCQGLVVNHAQKAIGLGGFPSRVRQLVAAQNKAAGSTP